VEELPVLVGGQIIPLEATSLLLAGAQSATWVIPIVLSMVGIGIFLVSRKSENKEKLESRKFKRNSSKGLVLL